MIVDMTLTGAVAIITGGRRIGRVVARELARRGADVVLSYRGSKTEAEETAADVVAAGRRASIVRADVAVPADCTAIVDHAVRTFGRVDVLVNMASIYRPAPLDAITPEHWDTDLDVNLRSAFLCAHAAIPHMRKAGGGRIVNFADWLARSGRPRYPGFTSYYVAKAGVVALTEALALELARDHVLVNAIAPGPIVPPPDMSQAEVDEVASATPLGRWGGEIEIAKAVVLLCETDFITGETIRVDGGRHLA
jgi:NAD(P)-dependent dehydrogenase (short-subunit alcohol dehydrogenase family)